jgi:hypothetical protein
MWLSIFCVSFPQSADHLNLRRSQQCCVAVLKILLHFTAKSSALTVVGRLNRADQYRFDMVERLFDRCMLVLIERTRCAGVAAGPVREDS